MVVMVLFVVQLGALVVDVKHMNWLVLAMAHLLGGVTGGVSGNG